MLYTCISLINADQIRPLKYKRIVGPPGLKYRPKLELKGTFEPPKSLVIMPGVPSSKACNACRKVKKKVSGPVNNSCHWIPANLYSK